MESIISRQKVSRRREAGARRHAASDSDASAQGVRLIAADPHPRPTGASLRSALLSRRLPVSTTPSDFAFRAGDGRPVEFRQVPLARKQVRVRRDPPDRDQTGPSPRRRRKDGVRVRVRLRRVLAGIVGGIGPVLAGTSLRLRVAIGLSLLLMLAALGVTEALLHPLLPLPHGALLPEDGASENLLLAYVTPEMNSDGMPGDAVSLPPLPATLELKSYTVRSKDTLDTVARRFGIAVDTLVSMNGITSVRSFRLGAELRIPNMNGLLYRVRTGDSLSSISALYHVDAARIADANDLGSAIIKVGQSLFIPGARLSEAELKRIFGEKVIWPLRGPLTSYFGYRPDPFTGVRSFHAGIDIAASPGTSVRAAMDGRVADVGYNPTYGNYIILSHSGGIQTLYGHLTSYSVRIGQKVSQGEAIGLTGSTGYSTGPHLHFGLYHHGNPVDPLKYLK